MNDDRDIKLMLTFRQACIVEGLFRKERKSREKRVERENFVPAPGKFDANKMRITVMDDLLTQLKSQIEGG